MSEARKRSEMVRELVISERSSRGTTPRLGTRTGGRPGGGEDSTVGSSSEQAQAPKSETEKTEPVAGSGEQEQVPKAETKEKEQDDATKVTSFQ